MQLRRLEHPRPVGGLHEDVEGASVAMDRERHFHARLALRVDMPRLARDEMLHDSAAAEPSAAVRARVEAARQAQHDRGQRVPNARLGAATAREAAAMQRPARALLGTAIDRLALTARGCDRVIRVARTVADLGGSERVEAEHLAEAIRYRSAGGVG